MQYENAFLGIELGSTRIKAVLVDESHEVIVTASYEWENHLENGYWTYSLEDVWAGLQGCFQDLAAESQRLFGAPLATVRAIGISAMMNGYLVFDRRGRLLTPFRTWRNTSAGQASEALSALFDFYLPQRWSAAHLYQAILNGEEHVKDIAFMTTLSGYIHWKLTGKKILGICDASGMFPIDNEHKDYDAKMLSQFDGIASLHRKIQDILPVVHVAGDQAGVLSEEGARLLDPTGTLCAGIDLCPPEGDAGTGMVATNSIFECSANVSAGTSIFAMIVLEKALSVARHGVDVIFTPAGKPVAMIQCNTCTSDIDAWVSLFEQVTNLIGARASKSDLYAALYAAVLEGEADCGGLLSYNFFAGEPLAGVDHGGPLLCRKPDSQFTPANLMRSLVFSAVAGLTLGMDILAQEHVKLDRIVGHGGFFKSRGVSQRLLAAALNAPVTVMTSAGEGGAWGIALLAAYMAQKSVDETLEDYLEKRVFAGRAGTRVEPDKADCQSFGIYMERYRAGLEAVKITGKI